MASKTWGHARQGILEVDYAYTYGMPCQLTLVIHNIMSEDHKAKCAIVPR